MGDQDIFASNDGEGQTASLITEDEIEKMLETVEADYGQTVISPPDNVSMDEIEKLVRDAEKRPDDGAALLDSLSLTEGVLAEKAENDLLSDVPEETLAELQDKFKILEEREDIQEELNAASVFIKPVDDLDAEIRKALENDQIGEAGADFGMEEPTLIEDVKVFDLENRDDFLSEQERRQQKAAEEEDESQASLKASERFEKFIKSLSPKIYVCTGIAASLLVFFSVFAFAYFSEDMPENTLVISQPAYTNNSGNIIFVDQSAPLGDSLISIYKMQISPSATVFYLTGNLDIYAHNVTMTDENGKRYTMNLADMPDRGASASTRRTTLVMQPLDTGIKGFSLLISDPESAQTVSFHYLLDKRLVHNPAKYLTDETPAETSNPHVSVSVMNAVFSSAASAIDFTFSFNGGNGRAVMLDNTESDMIRLTEDGRTVLIKNVALTTPFDVDPATWRGRAVFDPLKNLQGNLSVTFNSLYEAYDLNERFPVLPLMNARGDSRQILPVDSYHLYIERVIRGRGKFVMVVHTEDTRAEVLEDADTAEALLHGRVETRLLARLLAHSPDGETIEVNGVVRAGQIGADIVFDCSPYAEQFGQIPLSDIEIVIDTAQFKCNAATVEIDCGALPKAPAARLEISREIIEGFFESRLAYKSGWISRRQIQGFSSALLARRTLMNHYAPEPSAQEAEYSAQVVSLDYQPDNLTAVVKEIWQGSGLDPGSDFILTHKISAENDGNAWIIVSDEIIE